MSSGLEFLPEAFRDAGIAVAYYEKQIKGLGGDFGSNSKPAAILSSSLTNLPAAKMPVSDVSDVYDSV